MFRHKLLWVILSTGFVWAWAQPYEIRGIVQDENRMPLAQMTVYLIYDDGLQFETITNLDGTFKFEYLPEGEASCFVKLTPGYQPLSPPCAVSRINVANQPFLNFSVGSTTTGVVVTFGSPKGNGPSIESYSNEADALLILTGLNDYASEGFADEIVITGFWQILNLYATPIPTLSASINQYLGFHDYQITLTPMQNARVSYTISGDPGVLAKDGPIASILLNTPETTIENLPLPDSPIVFCMESVLVYAGGKIIDEKYNLGWQGILEVNPD